MRSLSQSETGLTKVRAAEFLGVGIRQLERYVEKGMPRTGTGQKVRFGPPAFAWHREFEAAQNTAGEDAGELVAEQARKTKIDADRALLKLLKEQGELVSISTVLQKQQQINSIIKMRLLALPGKMAPIVFGMESKAKIKAKLEAEVYEALEELKSEGKR